MNYTLLHDFTFFAMYGTAALGAYAIVERMIFYHFTMRHSRLAVSSAGDAAHANGALRGVAGDLHDAMLRETRMARNREELADRSEAIYLAARPLLLRRLWLLDTIVTAAPLLGLLGTILGIIDTFGALAQSGISDPAAVSRGIGTALFATALGIAIALAGLVFNNLFQDKVEEISNLLKVIILKSTTTATHAPAGAGREVAHMVKPSIVISA
jgi:biopolymer transport protein ExbB